MSKFVEIKNNFSKKQRVLYEKIKSAIGDTSSIALISLQGESETSQKEISVIAEIIAQFKPIEVTEHQDSPRKVVLSGKRGIGHTILISPQFKVKHENPKAPAWSIDVLLEVFRSVGEEKVKVAAIGIEYDGHPSHFVERGVIKAYKRDMHMASSEGIQTIRIAPDDWKNDPNKFITAVKKYVDRKIDDAEKLQLATIKAITSNNRKISKSNVICPICDGYCILAGEFCPICKGIGRVSASIATTVNSEDFEMIDCKLCTSKSSTCQLCLGTGTVPLPRAIEHKRNEAT